MVFPLPTSKCHVQRRACVFRPSAHAKCNKNFQDSLFFVLRKLENGNLMFFQKRSNNIRRTVGNSQHDNFWWESFLFYYLYKIFVSGEQQDKIVCFCPIKNFDIRSRDGQSRSFHMQTIWVNVFYFFNNTVGKIRINQYFIIKN